MKIRISILVFLLALLSSCNREIHFDFPDVEPAIVINSIITPESSISVSISAVMPIAEESYTVVNDTDATGNIHFLHVPKPKYCIEDATVLIYEDGELFCSLEYDGEGYYISDKYPKVGSTYTIVVNAPGYKECKATTTLYNMPVLSNRSFRDTVSVDQEGFPLSKLSFTITDNNPNHNFYEMSCRAVSDKYDVDIYFNKSRNTDKALAQSECLLFDNSVLLFTDKYFSNGSYNLDVIYNYSPYVAMPKYDLEITVKTISESYYEYRRSRIMQEYQEEGLFENLANGETLSSIPVDIYSNIENGFGIFASYSTMTDTIMRK